MIANVHNYRGALPEKRVDLYAEICDVLLGHWQRGKGLGERLTAAQRRVALQPLADAMMRRNLREIRTQDALAVMREHLLRIGISEEEIPAFLPDLQANCGVLVEKEVDVWAFAHLTFQEYLCAAHWKASGKALQWEFPQWQSLIAESWWHETLLLYAAQQDATPLVNACLQINSPSALRLAANMSREALQLESSLRETIAVSLKTLIIQLRREPKAVSEEEFIEVFQLDDQWRPLAYIQNEYEDQGEVIIDHATGLMWQKSGSDEELTYQAAPNYIIQLNQQRFAGHSDWRLPTIPELMSLLEPEKQANDLYINPRFDARQRWCWSADRILESSEQSASRQGGLLAWFQRLRGRGRRGSSGSAWDVLFLNGSVHWDYFPYASYVRAVRSRQ
ncbi:serine/threonine protein kinase [Candidatus Vecturithrix granuli]|uniref:Serine/threonine protein kinase n=1 Tax=Vecturithrix granuli TaxID=1499967 RepID=A0A081BWC1_VECG1|nr:serine/threonine protein kinase [Candidatus Vecturithrix granuli]